MSDEEIISLLLRDAAKGMKVLIDDFSTTVYAVVTNRLSPVCSHDEIDECVNRVFAEFYFNARNFNAQKCSIKTYLTVMARNKAIETFRKHLRYAGDIHIDGEELIELPDTFDLENAAERRLLEERLLAAVDSLGIPDSQIIIRKYFYAQTSRQIADAFGMTDAAVRKRISRSLQKLKELLGSNYNIF